MFVFTQLKISESIKTILRRKLPADHAILNSPLLSGKREIIDFLIIHRKIGVILVEVKASSYFSNSVQRKAKSQLQNAEEIIHALLQQDDQDVKHEIAIPVYKVIAMPSVNDRCYENEDFINLGEITVRSVDDFRSWWEKGFPEKKFGHQDKCKVQNLISDFVCESSEVSADAVILDVCMKIEKQKFLETSYKKSTRKAACESQGVEKAESVLAKQFMFLNPDQLGIWNGPPHQFFNGSSGSGKTILLQFKALECAKNGKKVLAVAPSSLKALFQAFFVEHNIHSGVDVLSPIELRDLVKDEVPGEVRSRVRFQIFVDEFQAFLTEIPHALKLLKKLIKMAHPDCYCWIAYDYMQISIGETQDTVQALLSGAKVHAEAQKASKTLNFHHGHCLSTMVRATFEVYSFVQAFVKKTLEDLLQKMKLPRGETREVLTKFVKRYDVSNYLGHRICGPSVTVLHATDSEFISQIIQEEVKMWTNEDSLHHVAVLLTDSVSKEHLSSAIARREIPVCDIGDQKNAVALDFASKALSYEWPVVIAISGSPHLSSNYTMFTRAVARLVIITSGDISEYFPSIDRIICSSHLFHAA